MRLYAHETVRTRLPRDRCALAEILAWWAKKRLSLLATVRVGRADVLGFMPARCQVRGYQPHRLLVSWQRGRARRAEVWAAQGWPLPTWRISQQGCVGRRVHLVHCEAPQDHPPGKAIPGFGMCSQGLRAISCGQACLLKDHSYLEVCKADFLEKKSFSRRTLS